MSILFFFYVDQTDLFFSVGLCASECFYVFKDQGNTLASCHNKMSTPEVFEAAKPEAVNNGSRIQENKHRIFHGSIHSVHSVEG